MKLHKKWLKGNRYFCWKAILTRVKILKASTEVMSNNPGIFKWYCWLVARITESVLLILGRIYKLSCSDSHCRRWERFLNQFHLSLGIDTMQYTAWLGMEWQSDRGAGLEYISLHCYWGRGKHWYDHDKSWLTRWWWFFIIK